MSPSATFLSLVDRQVVVFHRQGENSHGGGVDFPGASLRAGSMPGPVLPLEFLEDVLYLFTGFLGVVSSPLVHGLGLVVSPVVEEFSTRIGPVFEEPISGPFDKGGFVLSTDLHGEQTGSGGRIFGVSAGLVGKP